MNKILLFFQIALLGIFGAFLILCLYFAIFVASFFNCGNDSQKESIWKGAVNASWYDNSKTEFTITTAEQLAGFARLVNKGKDFRGKTVYLGANIDLERKDWTLIGKEYLVNDFRGTFDGKGFVVSGLYINTGLGSHGLFGSNMGIIKNLGIIDSYVGGNFDIGGLAAINGGRIENCYFSGKVGLKSTNGGGLVGNNRGFIRNSYSTSVVIGRNNVGGFVGYNEGTIENSYYYKSGSIGAIGKIRGIGKWIER